MRRSAAPFVLLLLAGCASSRPAPDEAPVVDVQALQAERDSLRAVADSRREELSLLADSVVRLRNTNEALVGRRRAPGTPPSGTTGAGTTTASTTTTPPRTPPRTNTPARPTPAKPDPTTNPPAPNVQGNPTAPDLPQEAFSDTLTADELFMPASATVSPLGQAILDRVAYELTRMPATLRFRVEGHADNSPPGPTIRDRWPTNWELSSARAAAVIRYLVEQGLPETRFELASFSATQPVAGNDTPQNRARNRRVVIIAR